MNDWQIYGVWVSDLVAGFLGGMVALSYLPRMTWVEMISTVLVGIVVAAYAGPVVSEYLQLSRVAQRAVSALSGLIGMAYVIPSIMRAASMILKKPEQWLKKLIKEDDR